MRSALIAVAAVLALARMAPASATGTLVCEAQDKTLDFSVTGALGGMRHNMVVNLGGNLALKAGGVPDGLRDLKLAKEDVTQAWLDERKLLLELYREQTEGRGAYVLLMVETKFVKEGEYRGRYLLETDVVGSDGAYGSKPRKLRGKVACFTG